MWSPETIKNGAEPKSHTSRKHINLLKITNETQNPQNQTGQTIIVNQIDRKSNGVGTAGFVLALIAVFFGWIPVLGW